MSNQYSHLDWTRGDIPRDRPGHYIVLLDRPSLGSRIAVCRAAQGADSIIVTINSNFEFDCGGRKIVAWVETRDLEPME